MSAGDWVFRHSDAFHAGGREACEHCQAMIELYGPMPPAEEIMEASQGLSGLLYQKVDIPKALRLEVFERDGYRCQHCGSAENLRADHIYPERKGGKLELSNLQTLCNRCNSSKRDRV